MPTPTPTYDPNNIGDAMRQILSNGLVETTILLIVGGYALWFAINVFANALFPEMDVRRAIIEVLVTLHLWKVTEYEQEGDNDIDTDPDTDPIPFPTTRNHR